MKPSDYRNAIKEILLDLGEWVDLIKLLVLTFVVKS